uniref:Uncharacterized protein n=1 Tax=Ixodes ricinus TaxID=34613 RepID=A0A6B0UEY0_IXORI
MLVFSLWNFIALSFVWLKDFGVVFGSGSNINVCFGSYLYAQLFGCGAYSRVLHFFFVTMVNTQICLIFTWQDDDHHLFCPAVLDRSLFSSFLPLNSTSSL